MAGVVGSLIVATAAVGWRQNERQLRRFYYFYLAPRAASVPGRAPAGPVSPNPGITHIFAEN